MSWEVRTQEDPVTGRIRLAITRPIFDHGAAVAGVQVVTQIGGPGNDLELRIPDPGTANWSDLPSLEPDLARALLDALARELGGITDQRQLREDYLAERRRGDKMLDALIVAAVGRRHP